MSIRNSLACYKMCLPIYHAEVFSSSLGFPSALSLEASRLSASRWIEIFLMFSHFIPKAVGTEMQIMMTRKTITCETAILYAWRSFCINSGDRATEVRPVAPAFITSSADISDVILGISRRSPPTSNALPIGAPKALSDNCVSMATLVHGCPHNVLTHPADQKSSLYHWQWIYHYH